MTESGQNSQGMDGRRTRNDRRRRQPITSPRPLVSLPMIWGVALVAVMAVAGLIYLGERLRQPPPGTIGSVPAGETGPAAAASPATSAQAPAGSAPAGTIVYDGKSKGPKDGPVELIEYADFQCPVCGAHARLAAPRIDEAYVAKGQVRVTFRHFPFIGLESLQAAMASECANEQGQFWPYHDKIFANQSGENQGAFAADKLKGFARDLGLDTARFDACVDSNKYRDPVREQFNEGQRAGVRATPTFFLSEQKIEGAQPFQVFQRLIDNELAKRR